MSFFKPTGAKGLISRKYGRLSLSALKEEIGKEMILAKSPYVELTEEGKQKCFTQEELLPMVKQANTLKDLYWIAGLTYHKKVLTEVQKKVAALTV